jgi:hypothetical protein
MIKPFGAITKEKSKIVNKWPFKKRTNAILSLLLEFSTKEFKEVEFRKHNTFPDEYTDKKLIEEEKYPTIKSNENKTEFSLEDIFGLPETLLTKI